MTKDRNTQHTIRRVVTEGRAQKLYDATYAMMCARSWSFRETTGHDFTELMGVCEGIFMEAFHSYDPNRGAKFSTWLYRLLNQGLIDYTQHNDLPPDLGEAVLEEIVPDHRSDGPYQHMRVVELRSGLSDDARYILDLLLNAPVEALRDLGAQPPKIIRGILQRYLRAEGWKWKRIWEVMAELKTTAARI